MSAYTEEQKKTLEEYIKNNVEAGLELSWYFAPVGEAGGAVGKKTFLCRRPV